MHRKLTHINVSSTGSKEIDSTIKTEYMAWWVRREGGEVEAPVPRKKPLAQRLAEAGLTKYL